ncbi:hypothetical protein FHS76_003285 [Ochrobactrum daejeonense]|uniref:Uncharacterized protein n=1 Tax=Brucella daejeonensis TaxID=659015 RepID=A0A7W9AZC2_9HYPH|nr:hypothetical protein [Brucella daejeonensis]MBB5703382.1 hypothetical protein [Brucella daejeonensis]
MIRNLHPFAGALTLLTIITFWLSTVSSELFGSKAAIIAVKTSIPWGFLLLVPVLALTGATGFTLAKGRTGLVDTKIRRMPLIAANGLLILIPAALFLSSKARIAEFDVVFYAVQALELASGAVNITLLGLNMRDGLRMKNRLGLRKT